MTKEIKDAIRGRLVQSGLGEKHLDKPGTHIIVSDGDQLHVLLKKGAARNDQIDHLEAEVKGARTQHKLDVTEEDPLDLGELGQWRNFVLEAPDGDTRSRAMQGPHGIAIFAAGKEGAAPGTLFATDLDFRFAMIELLGNEALGIASQLAVRPVPPGKRKGKEFVEVTPERREVLHRLLEHYVDETVPVDTLEKAVREWRRLQAEVYSTGIIGVHTLGLAPERPAAPLPSRDTGGVGAKTASGDGSGLTGASRAYLEAHGLELPPGKPTATWAEKTINAFPRDVPPEIAKEIRQLFRELKLEKARQLAELMGEEAPASAVPESRQASPLDISRRMKLDQLRKGLDGLGVPDVLMASLADQLAAALQPSKTPASIIIAGPRHSAADRMVDLVLGIIGSTPVPIGRENAEDASLAGLYANKRGIFTYADALLSETVISAHRTGDGHVPIFIENLADVGFQAGEGGRERVIVELLDRIAEMKQTGTVNTYVMSEEGVGRLEQSRLVNTVFVLRWEGPVTELDEMLVKNPKLQGFRVIAAPELAPANAVTQLEQELTFQLEQVHGPNGSRVELSKDLRKDLADGFKNLGAQAVYNRFAGELWNAVHGKMRDVPAAKYVVTWNPFAGLTPEEQAGIMRGKEIPFAEDIFAAEAR